MISILKKFEWNYLKSIYGSSHSSIIGFLSYQWIKQNKSKNSVLDGAPSPEIGKGRTGQINADLLLLENEIPKIIIEVETVNWMKKAENIIKYLDNENYNDAKGLLLLTIVKAKEIEGNIFHSSKKEEENLKRVKTSIKRAKKNISIIEIWRKRIKPKDKESFFTKIQERTDYYKWQICSIKYWEKNKESELLKKKIF